MHMHTCNHTFPVAAYRISEYTMDVDFLQNHGAASKGAMPVYAQNGGAMNETEIAQIDGVRCALAAALEHLGAPVACTGCKCHSVCVPEAATVCRVPEYVRAQVTVDGCLAALRAHGCAAGTSFECMACADAHRPAVVAQCGNFSDGDSRAHGWAVHFYCGIGWPGSSFQVCTEHGTTSSCGGRWAVGGGRWAVGGRWYVVGGRHLGPSS